LARRICNSTRRRSASLDSSATSSPNPTLSIRSSDTFDPVLGHAVLIDSLLLNRHGAPCLEHLVVVGGTRDVRVTRYSKAQFGKFVLQHFRDRLDLLDAFGVDLIRIKIEMNFEFDA
jgi:hypothetical protein